ncbi:MAG: homocysteine S-methyltransferase family protein, partial [Prevotella sp.]
MDKAYLESILQQRIMILDGAMGTTIQQYGLGEKDFKGERFAGVDRQQKGNNDILNITQPQVIADIHRKYLDAGADIITTNTFCSQVVSQMEYGLADVSREMALQGARIARKVADEYSTPDKPRWVAGSVGPTNKTCSLSPDVNNPAARDIHYDNLYTAYHTQIDAMAEGGIDLLLVETIFDTLNAKAAVAAAMDVMEERMVQLPVILSITVSDANGRMLGGQTIEAFLATISTLPVFAVSMNCSLGAKQMKPLLRTLSEKASCYVAAYPNAGMPNCMGEYDETAEEMSAYVAEFIEEGLVNIVGGCCGTTDEFIRSFARLAEDKQPRKVPAKNHCMQLAGLEALYVNSTTGFVNVGERCNVAGSRKFLRLIGEKKYEEALAIARKQVEDGAMVIDINMDDGLLDAEKEMTTFLNLIASEPDIAAVPVMIDSSDWKVIASALKCVQGKCIVNSISLKGGEQAFLEHAALIKRHGAAAVVMCFDEQGQATTYERRIEIAERAYRLLTQQVGMAPHDIIFDPNILAIATG